AVQKEGVAAILFLRNYQAVEVKQAFTKIRKEIEKQRDLFWDLRSTVCLGSRKNCLEKMEISMRDEMWLCLDPLCRAQPWRNAEAEPPALDERYQMDPAQKKRLQEAAECLDEERFQQELDDSYRCILPKKPLNGQMLEDWFEQIVDAANYGMGQSGNVEER